MFWHRKANRFVSSLAKPFEYDDPFESYLSLSPNSDIIKLLIRYGLALNTRKSYIIVINSYNLFYVLHCQETYLSSTIILEEWVVTKILGSTLPKQAQIKPDTMINYLSTLKSYHTDRNLSLKGFDDPWMALIIKSRKLLFHSKKQSLLITKNILKNITDKEPISITDLNVYTLFKLAWAGFIKMEELRYTAVKGKKAIFTDTSLTRSDILFVEKNQYVILSLKVE